MFTQRGTSGGGQFASPGNQARGVSGAGTNAGSFKAHAASESSLVLPAPPPEYSPRDERRHLNKAVHMDPDDRRDYLNRKRAARQMAGYTGAYDAALLQRGTPTEYGAYESRLAPDEQELLEADIQDIADDPSLSADEKLRYQDMAAQLDRFGAGYHGGAGPVKAVRFDPGSRYGADIVPGRFKNFTAKVDAQGRAANAEMDRRARDERAQRAAEAFAVPAAPAPAAEASAKQSVFGKLFGR